MEITLAQIPGFFQVTARLHHRRSRRRGRSQRRKRRRRRRTRTRRRAALPRRRSRTLRKSRKRTVIRPRPSQPRLPLLLRTVRGASPPWHAPTSGRCSLAAPKLEEEAKKIRLPPGKYLSILRTDLYDKQEA